MLSAPSRCMHRNCARKLLCRGAKACVWRVVSVLPAAMVPAERFERHTLRQISLRCGIGGATQTGTERRVAVSGPGRAGHCIRLKSLYHMVFIAPWRCRPPWRKAASSNLWRAAVAARRDPSPISSAFRCRGSVTLQPKTPSNPTTSTWHDSCRTGAIFFPLPLRLSKGGEPS